jgi:hypothetical protein
MGRCKQKLGYSKFDVCFDFKNGTELGDQESIEEYKNTVDNIEVKNIKNQI